MIVVIVLSFLLLSELSVLTDGIIIATTRTKHNPEISDPHHTKNIGKNKHLDCHKQAVKVFENNVRWGNL